MNHDDVKSNVLTTTLESAINWGRKNSLWPMPFGTACCGIRICESHFKSSHWSKNTESCKNDAI